MKKHLNQLKQQIQQCGALRPSAWEAIQEHARYTETNIAQGFIRIPGSMAYIASGLLKEYDSQDRSVPAIINFIGTGQFVITQKHNQPYYLKACLPTTIIHWSWESLMQLYQEFAELKPIYDSFCASYNIATAQRQLILEQKSFKEKICLFRKLHQNSLIFLKKKDIANYLHISYNYFVHHWVEQF